MAERAPKPEKRARYRRIEVRMWSDEKFRELTPMQPCGQALWLFLLTGPQTGPIPGLFRAGRAVLADELGWDLEAFDEAFAEAFRLGMVKADWKAKVVWIPNAIRCNPPESVNVIKSWRNEWDLVPECDLKREAYDALKATLGKASEAYEKAFVEACRKPSPKPSVKPSPKASPNSSDNQEQEQEYSVAKATGVPPDPPPDDSQGDLLGDQPAGMTAQEAVWSLGVPILVAAGQAERNARSLLGKWCKAYGAPAVQAAIVRCAQEQPLEPVSWLIAALGAPKAADGGQGARSGGSAPGGDWWAKAGFAKEYEATNAGCSERYAHLWRNGERIPDAERRAMAGVPR
ncbi:hypothetical protein [Burkholderia gladioli]|uniref:hypothetical protein n=1 Tax=Burkholderia gladioli TaxID=28095 RepID=UPI00163F1614|nr:hypothetical protein [Burkholderia gladioli]